MSAVMAVVQAQALLSQLYINTRLYKHGGIVPANTTGEIVSVNMANDSILNKEQIKLLLNGKELK